MFIELTDRHSTVLEGGAALSIIGALMEETPALVVFLCKLATTSSVIEAPYGAVIKALSPRED